MKFEQLPKNKIKEKNSPTYIVKDNTKNIKEDPEKSEKEPKKQKIISSIENLISEIKRKENKYPETFKTNLFFSDKILNNTPTKDWDIILDSLIFLAPKYPEYICGMLDMLGQNGQVIEKHTWINAMSDVFSTPGITNEVKETALSSSNYLFSFFKGYDEEILKKLDFQDEKKYAQTGKLLRFVYELSKYSKNFHFSEKNISNLKKILSETTKNNSGNYLLNKYSENLLNALENKNLTEINSYLPIFEITKEKYASIFEDGYIRIATTENFEKINNIMDVLLKHDLSKLTEKEKSHFDQILVKREQLMNELNEIKEIPNTSRYTKLIDDNGQWEEGDPEITKKKKDISTQIDILEKEIIELTKPLNLKNIRQKQEKARNELYDSLDIILQPEDLVTDSKKYSTEQLNDYYKDYVFMQNAFMRHTIEKDFNFKINELNLVEQFQFLNFLKTKKFNEISIVKKFTNKYKENGFRTFISIEHGGKEMGDKILELGEKLPEDVAKKVFAKYGEIIDSANRAEEEVKNLYEKENISNEIFESIKETLLKRGVKLLSSLSDDIKEDININEQKILSGLEDIKTQTIIMGSSYIELYKQDIKIPIEDISNTSLGKISAQNLTKEEKQELLKVYENGRPKETYENKEHIKLLKDEFEQTLNNKDTFIFNVRFNDEIIAFATFNKENEDTLHIGGLTFIDDVRNPAIAVAVLNTVMDEFKDFNIKALVHSKNKILPMYQKRFGFKITGELPLQENAGELYYEIERPKKIEEKQEFKQAA